MRIAEDQGVQEVLAFATSAIREAPNGEAVLAAIRSSTGAPLQVLSGQDEARLTFLAVRRWFGWSSGHLLALDIGGGSLEIAAGIDEVPDAALSLPLGAGRLTREFLPGDPPTAQDVRALRRHVRVEIGSVVRGVVKTGTPDRVVGTSKTLRSLARVAGAAPSSDGPYAARELRAADVAALVDRLAGLTTAQRRRCRGCRPSGPASCSPARSSLTPPWTCSVSPTSTSAPGRCARGSSCAGWTVWPTRWRPRTRSTPRRCSAAAWPVSAIPEARPPRVVAWPSSRSPVTVSCG